MGFIFSVDFTAGDYPLDIITMLFMGQKKALLFNIMN